MVIFVFFVVVTLVIVAAIRYRANKTIADLNNQNAVIQKTIQDAIDELGRVAADKSISATELTEKSEITFAVLQSYNEDGGLNPLIQDTQEWLKVELAKRQP